MSQKYNDHIEGLLKYLFDPDEKANEDLALKYFRKVFGEKFTRQAEAKHADGYLPGYFVLELKGKANSWLRGLFQGIAYRRDLDFSLVVVAAKQFLAVWDIDSLPSDMVNATLSEVDAASTVGSSMASKFLHRKNELLKLAIWKGNDLFGELFKFNPELINSCLRDFETVLKSGKKTRQKITLRNFTNILQQMAQFFDPENPIKAVRAFYSMVYGWNEHSVLEISHRVPNQATLGGETIEHLIPGKRELFKDFVESHVVSLKENEDIDDFFTLYDKALDAVDKEFRIKHGIFFTDLDLSRFVMWYVKKNVPDLGRNYLVIDPAAGSGNLVTNWRSPLELRHKVVSEIEPELLFTVEQRMKGDQWHNGKYTVVPKVSLNQGLNFIDRSALDYLQIIKEYLAEKGQKPDKPLAFLCNPPYRSDDDQTAESVAYKIHPSIIDLTGKDASSERYCCFLAQMKLICEAAPESGIPDESVLLLFTKAAWLTKRPIFTQIRAEILGAFEDIGGILVNSREFFDVKGKFPVAFTMWRYKGDSLNSDRSRSIPLTDLTWVTKSLLNSLQWEDANKLAFDCNKILNDTRSIKIQIGADETKIREWVGVSMLDFKRSRRISEKNQSDAGGLPAYDPRRQNKKTYGESLGNYIGFMDDLTPCRIKSNFNGRPWFRLNSQFMDCRKTRCLSGPPDHLGYSPLSEELTEKMFIWFAMGRTFAQCGYPLWVDAMEIWQPIIPDNLKDDIIKLSFAIGFADNECIETIFPTNNPIHGAPEIVITNPMTPLNKDSFWTKSMAHHFTSNTFTETVDLVEAVNKLFCNWKQYVCKKKEVHIGYKRPYFISEGVLTLTSGLVQIKDFAQETGNVVLLNDWREVQERSKAAKKLFYKILTDTEHLNYFSQVKVKSNILPFIPKTKFDHVLEKRLSLAAILVSRFHDDPNFGRTKFAKLFYLLDVSEQLELQTNYIREAAGPLDPRALYNHKIGIEPLGHKYGYFNTITDGTGFIRYKPGLNINLATRRAKELMPECFEKLDNLFELFKGLDTQRSELVATLFACWNDILLKDKIDLDDTIINDFLSNWHERKTRFSKARLLKELNWMKENGIVPTGKGRLTTFKSLQENK